MRIVPGEGKVKKKKSSNDTDVVHSIMPFFQPICPNHRRIHAHIQINSQPHNSENYHSHYPSPQYFWLIIACLTGNSMCTKTRRLVVRQWSLTHLDSVFQVLGEINMLHKVFDEEEIYQNCPCCVWEMRITTIVVYASVASSLHFPTQISWNNLWLGCIYC